MKATERNYPAMALIPISRLLQSDPRIHTWESGRSPGRSSELVKKIMGMHQGWSLRRHHHQNGALQACRRHGSRSSGRPSGCCRLRWGSSSQGRKALLDRLT